MHVYTVIILTPILLLLWVYLFIMLRHALFFTTNIELNIVDEGIQPIETSGNSNIIKDHKRNNRYHIPKFMLELYENNKSYGKNNYSAPDVVKSLIPTHAGALEENEIIEELSDKHMLVFDLPKTDEDEILVSAELKVLTLIDTNASFIKRNLKLSVYDDTKKQFMHLWEKEINHTNNTWLSFDVTRPVLDIFKFKRKENKFLKLMITVETFFPHIKNNFKLSLMPESDNFDHEYPILMLSYSSNNNNNNGLNLKLSKKETAGKHLFRNKRNAEEEYEEETNNVWDDEVNRKLQLRKIKKRNNCRKKPLYINFSEIDYDMWIVQPSGYEAYQCQGRCFYPVAEHLNPTKHAIVQALLHSVAPSRVSRSCCVPTVLDSISILYVDSNGVLTYRLAYKDMVVRECGCR